MATARKPRPVDDHPLAHLIPPMTEYDEYVQREVGGIKDVDLLRYARETKRNVLLFGPTGPGKTMLITAYCALNQTPLVTVNANGGIDPTTFFGSPVYDPETEKIKGWQDSDVLLVIDHGGFLYIDEINFMHPKIAAVFHPLLDRRRQVTVLEQGNRLHKAHSTLQVGAAYNPDYEGTKPLNKALKNRFAIKLHWSYSDEVEKVLVFMPVMLGLAKSLRSRHRAGELETPVSTNMLVEFEELAVDLGYDFAVENFLNAFNDEERVSVRDIMELESATIKEQLKQMQDLANEG